SYTGLRVGVSTAKGISFGGGIPLISVGTLDTLAFQAITEKLLPEGCRCIVPMIDARRMEVYCSEFDEKGNETGETAAVVLDENSFRENLAVGKTLFIGDGAEKFSEIMAGNANAYFVQCCPKASAMLLPALRNLEEGIIEDTAYFEPFYLKEFVATKSRKKIL
ncbi:MAG: tRNA (adenosine(37)-N6)-threonylcarbamoyltransferase complex dimerization subunit type 1 TsaB, partial [Muribaculum sp.]|nr:tRNA (adenosine(37)-N6)-threonylcarbamoyltransferase complex dimerization subunit type 1 TsaB [Candidatus Merdivivens faecigallinarum]